MTSTKLTKKQAGQLGGLKTAKKHDMARLGSKGGSATLEKHGREHFIRAAHKRWGRLS